MDCFIIITKKQLQDIANETLKQMSINEHLQQRQPSKTTELNSWNLSVYLHFRYIRNISNYTFECLMPLWMPKHPDTPTPLYKLCCPNALTRRAWCAIRMRQFDSNFQATRRSIGTNIWCRNRVASLTTIIYIHC